MIDAANAVRQLIPRTAASPAQAACAWRIEEASWGYRIVPTGTVAAWLTAAQTLAMLAGAGCVAMAFALCVLVAGTDLAMRVPAIFLIFGIGAVLMWFASRGTQVRVEVDTHRGELREVVQHRTGASSVLTRHGFDSVDSVFIARPAGRVPALTLRYRASARKMTVATGPEADLLALRDRMGRDVMLSRPAS
ncbi:hypothetical protein SAMN04488003_101138 [Loktanella fryxellensis]|uniref:Uncharacterized protein n=1 Tax=Loktanella fryxellensis TaxID=245187 RepID=A0A1H7YGJ6_9RHOB|nr:hypothetical protein [Loktanella fryxellensis]SEM44458.1 hypothetical protein SAMN04488003_101138 [Loktanella fryxellensis]